MRAGSPGMIRAIIKITIERPRSTKIEYAMRRSKNLDMDISKSPQDEDAEVHRLK
jgi:hypothetical protein